MVTSVKHYNVFILNIHHSQPFSAKNKSKLTPILTKYSTDCYPPKKSWSYHNNLAVIFHVDTLSVTKDEENPEAREIYQSDEGEHGDP